MSKGLYSTPNAPIECIMYIIFYTLKWRVKVFFYDEITRQDPIGTCSYIMKSRFHIIFLKRLKMYYFYAVKHFA